MSIVSSNSIISASRRDFLRGAIGTLALTNRASVASTVSGHLFSLAPKTVLVTFGGGARDEETFALEGQANIPHLLGELVPQGTFFTQVLNSGILGHYVATASILTGVYERFDNFIAQPPPSATLFEYFRKGLCRPADDAWVIAPSNGFQRIGASSNGGFGPAFGAGVVLPKQMLALALQDHARSLPSALNRSQFPFQDNFERPLAGHILSSREREEHFKAINTMLRFSVSEFVQQAQTLDSADELSVFIAKRLMGVFSPSLLVLTLHDMDIAHTGVYSLYVDAIQRADRLCSELWHHIQTTPEYTDRTTLLILPDFGRDADDEPAGNGFQHHRAGGPMARTTWLLALGPGIGQNRTVDRPIESIDIVPTIGRKLGFPTPGAQGHCIEEIL